MDDANATGGAEPAATLRQRIDPAIASAFGCIVLLLLLGGTSILGGRGRYLGTVAEVILVTLLQSILSVMQIEEFARHVIYGGVTITITINRLVFGQGLVSRLPV